MLDREKRNKKLKQTGCFCWRWSIRLSPHNRLSISCPLLRVPKNEWSQWFFEGFINLITFFTMFAFLSKLHNDLSTYLYGIWSNLRCRWSMGSISPKNKIQSTKICLVCPTRITFVHQIWYLMNSPICQVEHSPFHFIPYSVPHIYRSSTTALRRLYIQSTLSIMYRKNNWSVATSSSP